MFYLLDLVVLVQTNSPVLWGCDGTEQQFAQMCSLCLHSLIWCRVIVRDLERSKNTMTSRARAAKGADQSGKNGRTTSLEAAKRWEHDDQGG